jgi:hypothetical protein
MELLTMATHALPSPHILDDDAPQAPARPRKRSFMRRFYISLLIAQNRRARRDIDRILGDGTFKHRRLRPRP